MIQDVPKYCRKNQHKKVQTNHFNINVQLSNELPLSKNSYLKLPYLILYQKQEIFQNKFSALYTSFILNFNLILIQ